MFPHSLSSSPLIIRADDLVTVKLLGNTPSGAMLSSDSHNSIKLKEKISNTEIKVSERLVHPKDHDFYDGCRNKLGWSSSIVNNKK